MLHWRAKLLGLMLLMCGLASGCKQPLFMAEQDLQGLGKSMLLPPNLEHDPTDAILPQLDAKRPAPPTVNFPDRPPWPISLEEALAYGLEHGTTNSRQPFSGLVDDTLGTMSAPSPGFGGQYNGESETVRVLSLHPAMAYTSIETLASRYDVQFVSSALFSNIDSVQQGFQSFQNGMGTSVANSFVKALPTGGVANVSWLNEYKLLSNPPTGTFGVLNPSYTSRLVFGYDQPLWRDFGVDINQMLGRHPTTSPFSPLGRDNAAGSAFAGRQNGLSAGNEGILVARIRYNQRKAEFERQMNALVLNVEVAYWNLYQAYGELYANEEVLRIAHKSWMINKAKFDVSTKGPGDYYPFKAQYSEFRASRLNALAKVLEAERNLRGLMGLPVEDGKRLVPVTPPTLARYDPNFEAAVNDALINRPELTLAREQLRTAHVQLLLAKNQLKPDLHASALYSPVGFGRRLDGNGSFTDGNGEERPSNAWRSLASDHFNDWSIGLILNIPIGYRAEMAQIRSARLNLAQAYYLLKDHEQRSTRFVTQQYQAVASSYSLIQAHRDERRDYGEAVEARYKEFTAGKQTVDQFLLDMQRRFGAALVNEYKAIADYNIALAKLEWSKGTILNHNNVYLSEGPLPENAQVRAVEHEKERTKARILRDKPRALATPGQFVQGHHEPTGEPHWDELTGREPMSVNPAADKSTPAVPEQIPTPPSKLPINLTPAPAPQTIELTREPAGAAVIAIPEVPVIVPGTSKQGPAGLPALPEAAPGLPSIPASPFAAPPAVELPMVTEPVLPELPRER